MKNRICFEKFLSEDEFHYFLDLATNEKVEVMNYGRVFTLEEAKQIYEGMLKKNRIHESFGFFKVFLQGTNTYIGLGALLVNNDLSEGELEYMLLPEYWGQGYGSEIARELLKKAENTKSIQQIEATIDPNNTGSKKILLNNGFVSCKLYENPEDGSLVEMLSKKMEK
ncbi:GNAT family N-acetyltransferase [Clostridium sp.]|uniref:GNAT family N-acetyltransferase n=1 Tax=Clostridium sp. TaxID=1506 RepID=UPI0032174772